MEGTLYTLAIIAILFMQAMLVWSFFNMRNHIEKQTTILISAVRLLAKISQNTGSERIEVNKLLEELNSKL